MQFCNQRCFQVWKYSWELWVCVQFWGSCRVCQACWLPSPAAARVPCDLRMCAVPLANPCKIVNNDSVSVNLFIFYFFHVEPHSSFKSIACCCLRLSSRKSRWSLKVSRRTWTRCPQRQKRSWPPPSRLPLLPSCAQSSTSPWRRWITPTCSPLFISRSESPGRSLLRVNRKWTVSCLTYALLIH